MAEWPSPGTRLQRALAQAGVASRRASEMLITDGRVTVNGQVCSLGQTVGPTDVIRLDGRVVTPEPVRVILLNKAAGRVSTARDPQGRPTVLDDLTGDVRLYPVGRLDLDTTGALLVTNDGDLANGLMHPRRAVPKTYEVRVEGRVSAETVRHLRRGVELEDGPTLPAKVEVMDRRHPGGTWLRIEITEGRNRQVKRMCQAMGHPVTRLHRARYAGVGLQGLRMGEWRFLTSEEIARLRGFTTDRGTGEGAA